MSRSKWKRAIREAKVSIPPPAPRRVHEPGVLLAGALLIAVPVVVVLWALWHSL